ncbi:MAG TPA: EAL domain-containing protein [Xanthobacteraceae bacterium]|nr:EAL domain-containing protein [Xanthobacteraceae bacterium]
MSTSARPQIAEENDRSRWDQARLRLLVLIGAIVAIAVACLIVGVVASARRANEVSLNREQQLIRDAIAARGARVLREVESVAATNGATQSIRAEYDPQWVQRRLGEWLETFFDHDLVLVIDGSDHVAYAHARGSGNLGAVDLPTGLATVLDLLRGRVDALPVRTVLVETAENPRKPRRSAAMIENFLDRPAIVAAVAVGADSDLAGGNVAAPIVVSVKYIDDDMLREIASRLGLLSLRTIEDDTSAANGRVMAITDAQGGAIARFAWQPTNPGGQIARSVLPFVAIAIGGFVLLGAMVMCYMRRSAQALAAGETQLRHLALHDPVSGLPNRIYFRERLETVLGEVRRGGPSAAVFYIDLDHFKDVNDTLGHHIGDELILSVTQRLSQVMRGDDLVARLGGDEFAIITTCASDSYSLQAIAGRIIASVCAPYSISAHKIIIGASIGIAVIDRRAAAAADILRYADMALYRAKNEGRNRACIYDAAMDADLSERKLLEGDLLHAIRNDGLNAAYQPIVNASGDKIIGVEALARWTHPTAGVISPAVFIPIAEHSGLIVELGEWMLRRACLDGRNWPGLTVAVNVSPLQFRRSDFVDVVERILKETEFDPGRLELELTESTLLGNLETAELSMLRLKAIGVRFALDDFGTGYSSLLYLRRFPFDKLKIDSSFVRSIETAPDAAAIVHAVVSLGRGLGMRVTAEGVENAEQHLFLRAAGVHSMQGYRFGRPGAAADIDARLESPDDYRVGNPDQEIALAS